MTDGKKPKFIKLVSKVLRTAGAEAAGSAAAIAISIGLLSFSISSLSDVDVEKITQQFTFSDVVVAASAIATLFALTLAYLNRATDKSKIVELDRWADNSFSFLEGSIAKARHRIIEKFDIDPNDKDRVRQIIEAKIDGLADANIVESMRKNIAVNDRVDRYIKLMSQSISRIIGEIESLESRGNLNLSIGIVATVIGIIALGVFVFTTNYSGLNLTQFTYTFVPRLSLVLFIQVFAFFFLGLYKSNLSQIRYYHNELTAIESRMTSVAIAVETGDAASILKVVADLSAIDRNASGAGEPSADIERSTETLTKLLAAISPLLKKD